MSDFKLLRIYSAMPVWLQNIAITMRGVKEKRLRESPQFWKVLSFLEDSETWSLAELQNYQDERLRELIAHAYENVPYYYDLMRSWKLRPHEIRTVADLDKLPILTKATVRQRQSELLARGWPPKRVVSSHTGGSTGTPLNLAEDRDTWTWNWAILWRFRKRFGLQPGDSYITFGGRRGVVALDRLAPPFWRVNLASRQTYVSVHHMTVPNLKPLVEYLQKRRVAFYAGYPSALYILAVYLLRENIQLDHPPQVIITNSESLLPYQRRTISQAFGCKIADYYGQTEHCSLICECECHHYHVEMEFGVVEFLPVETGATTARRVISTGLQNPVMPLFRYDTGDLATLAPTHCPCGLPGQTVLNIDGRIEAVIITPEGRQLGRLDHLFKGDCKIMEAQFIQHRIDTLTVRIVRDSGYSQADENAFLQDLRAFMGPTMKIHFDYVAEIPRTANGKLRQVISTVATGHLQ